MDENIKNEEAFSNDTVTSASVETEAGEEIGNIKISVDVIATIAGMAAGEIEGVNGLHSSFAGGIAEMLGAKKSSGKGVKVELNDNTAAIDLYIVVDYGVRIPELAWEIQENVKNHVETMTGMNVEKVNIHIEGVSFPKETEEVKDIEDNEMKQISESDADEITD